MRTFLGKTGAGDVDTRQAARTAVAATVSLTAAQVLGLPEAYWAAITTLIVMQSTLGAALAASSERLIGTAIGAVIGAAVASVLPPNALAFGAAVFLGGLCCALLGVTRNAFRFASITIAIVLLVAHVASAWVVALHRFLEVSMGIIVALALTALWPEGGPGRAREASATAARDRDDPA